jgi:hypothetical protein
MVALPFTSAVGLRRLLGSRSSGDGLNAVVWGWWWGMDSITKCTTGLQANRFGGGGDGGQVGCTRACVLVGRECVSSREWFVSTCKWYGYGGGGGDGKVMVAAAYTPLLYRA